MVRRKYIVNFETSARAMLSSAKVQLAVGTAVVLTLALLSTLVYFYLKETVTGNESSENLVSPSAAQLHYRQQFVRNMTAQLWYSHHLGFPENRTSSTSLSDLRLTFAALTTLKVMELDNQFAAAKQTIVEALLKDGADLSLNGKKTADDLLPVDLVNEYLVALLSASALESEEDDPGSKLLQVAITRLVPLIERYYQWGDGHVIYESDSQQPLLTSEILAHYPVFNHLANVTSTRAYRNLVITFEDIFNRILLGRHEGPLQGLDNILLPLPVDLESKAYKLPVNDLRKARNRADVGELTASLLAIHLQALKSSLQVGRLERLFDFIKANLTSEWKPHSLYTKSFFDYNQEGTETEPSMHFSQCNLGSTLALGARALEEHLFTLKSMDEKMRAEEVKRYRAIAADGASLVDTCHQAAIENPESFLPSERFYLLKNGSIKKSGRSEHFSSQLAEAYFVLHRLTGKPIYQEFAWQLAQVLHRTLLTTQTTSSISSSLPPPQFFSATLKWLYLVQGDQLPLERWVFSRPAGHPLPVLGSIEWLDDGGYNDDEDNGDLLGASFFRPRGSRRKGAIIISESPDLN